MTLKLTKPLIVFDIESTGINVASDRIIEIAILKILPDQSQEIKKYIFNPGIPIPPESTEIHGFKDEDVKDCPPFSEKAQEISDFLSDSDIAGYNSNRFDVPIIVEEFLRSEILFDTKNRKFIDVFRIFTFMEKRDLTSAYKFYCGKELMKAHSAEMDVMATYEVLLSQLDRYDNLQNDVPFLHDFSKDGDFVDLGRRMIYINGEPHFNFGKHKGKKVTEVLVSEPQYYNWIMKSDFLMETKQKLKEIRLMMKNNS